ncbi:MAG: hypothetical protein GXP62_03980 [Oligoflexia bacterium]|nr:hypothetical protein [Oligoflexia bacterium]
MTRRTSHLVVGALALVAIASSKAQAKVTLTTSDALALAFPGCTVDQHTVYLTEGQRKAAAELAGADLDSADLNSAIVHAYRGVCDGVLAGTAYFDTHRVRTLPETLLIVVGPDDAIDRVEVLSFGEPEEYRPPAGFYGQFTSFVLGDALSYKRAGLRRVTGATLSSDATLSAVRRTLALHQVLQEGR